MPDDGFVQAAHEIAEAYRFGAHRLRSMIVLLAWALPAYSGALEEYVHRPDPAYAWSLYRETRDDRAHHFFLTLTSQHWLDANRVDRPLWSHDLRVMLPKNPDCDRDRARSSTAVLIIAGGRNRPDAQAPQVPPESTSGAADTFCRPVVQLHQIPNQPLRFIDDGQWRAEDALIALTFDRYLRGEPGDLPVHKAMVKGVVQAMNAVQEFARTRDDVPAIEDFVLLGVSKRGWTAWLTAAVDPRVRALIPVSIDMPNIPRQLEHHIGAYGDYARALGDYRAADIGCRLIDPRGGSLLDLVDPFAYRDRLAMPKLVINSAGDEFFVPDAWRFYLDDMPGLTSLRYTVNTDHGQGGEAGRHALFRKAANWIDSVVDGDGPPQLSWQREGDVLVVDVSEAPRRIRLWTADNPVARDFRLESVGAAWRPRAITPDPDGRYRVELDAPATGWRAALVEATFGGDRPGAQQVYTTGVFVTPERLPFPGPQCEVEP